MQFDISKILQRIEIKLAEIGMPKQEFYARSGISSASFSQWNTGAHKPTIKKLKDAADVLGTSVEYLLYGEESSAQFVARINTLLAKKDITKAEFYEKCGVTSASFSQWNTGKAKPRLKNIERIANFLGVSSEYLLYGEESPAQYIKKAPTSIAESERSRQIAARISEIVYQLYPETQESCLQYFESLLALQNAAQGRDIQG